MINAGVALRLPAVFNEWFSSYTFTLRSGNRSVTLLNGDAAYINLSADESTDIQFELTAVNTDGESFTQSGSFSGLQPGKLYEVTYAVETRSLIVR